MMVVIDICAELEKNLSYLDADVFILVDVVGLSHPGETVEKRCLPHRVLMIHIGPIL